MCRTPLTAHRSEAFTIKKGGQGREEEGMPGGRGRLASGKKELGSHRIWRIVPNFLEPPASVLRGAGGRARIG